MRGKKSDVLGTEVQQASLFQNPVNPIVMFGSSLNPMVQAKMRENLKADLHLQREHRVRVLNRSQGNLMALQTNSRLETFGPVLLPNYPGIWGGLQNG